MVSPPYLDVFDVETKVYSFDYWQLRLAEERRRSLRYAHFMALMRLDAHPFIHANGISDGQEEDKRTDLAIWIQNCIRETDLVASAGDDNLVLLLPETGRGGALQLSTRLEELIKAREGDKPFKIRIVVYPYDGVDESELYNELFREE
jgi:GGDEF domain-containing protein